MGNTYTLLSRSRSTKVRRTSPRDSQTKMAAHRPLELFVIVPSMQLAPTTRIVEMNETPK